MPTEEEIREWCQPHNVAEVSNIMAAQYLQRLILVLAGTDVPCSALEAAAYMADNFKQAFDCVRTKGDAGRAELRDLYHEAFAQQALIPEPED